MSSLDLSGRSCGGIPRVPKVRGRYSTGEEEDTGDAAGVHRVGQSWCTGLGSCSQKNGRGRGLNDERQSMARCVCLPRRCETEKDHRGMQRRRAKHKGRWCPGRRAARRGVGGRARAMWTKSMQPISACVAETSHST
eukprot:1282915-Pleurochrysis_carterae.AAC.1